MEAGAQELLYVLNFPPLSWASNFMKTFHADFFFMIERNIAIEVSEY
jgi:hypothetical protein